MPKNLDFEGVDKIILPGVGAFKDFMKKISVKKFDKILIDKVKKIHLSLECVLVFKYYFLPVMNMVIIRVLNC